MPPRTNLRIYVRSPPSCKRWRSACRRVDWYGVRHIRHIARWLPPARGSCRCADWYDVAPAAISQDWYSRRNWCKGKVCALLRSLCIPGHAFRKFALSSRPCMQWPHLLPCQQSELERLELRARGGLCEIRKRKQLILGERLVGFKFEFRLVSKIWS